MAKELIYKVSKFKNKRSEDTYSGKDKNEAIKAYNTTKPDKGGSVFLTVGQYEDNGEKLIGGISTLKLKSDNLNIKDMSKVKFVCGNCKSEVNDSDKFCTGCGKGLKPVTDSSNVEMTDEEFNAANDALEIIDAKVLGSGKIKLKGNTLPAAIAKFKKTLETSLYLRGLVIDIKEKLKNKPVDADSLKENLKSIQEQMKDADIVTNMWIDVIKKAMKGK